MELGRQINQASLGAGAQSRVSCDMATAVSPPPSTGAYPIAIEELHLNDLKNRARATATFVKCLCTMQKALGLMPQHCIGPER